jgi:phosphatidylglycerol:prolipoprotein diacylglycerol transferase
MAFHGGLLGTIVAFYLFSKHFKAPFFTLMDLIACAAPIGLFFGRIANFINGELYGRITNSSLGVIFPNGGPIARHPSQLYEAALEGLLLFIIMLALFFFTKLRDKPGALSGVFLIGYGISRSVAELFREPDAHLGFIVSGLTMGQLLSFPMVALGIYLIWRAHHAPRPTA